MKINAYAAKEPGAILTPYSYELGSIGTHDVDIRVEYSGLCHSDVSMINNEWDITTYPIVPGHEIIGEVVAIGSSVKNVKIGQKVGMGWVSSSCSVCEECMDGHHESCSKSESTIVGRHGGFADYVRGHHSWTIPLPEGIDRSKAGPLFCAGSTVFNAIVSAGVKPTDKVGVIGIGGLGHLALKFLKHWGCEVVAFSSNPTKKDEIIAMGATKVINSKEPKELAAIAGNLDFILNTTNVTLDWNAYLSALAPRGKFHTVGIFLEPMKIQALSLIPQGKSVTGSPVGGPALTRKMLEFCVRHNIYPTVEEFPMEKVNDAIKHLAEGKARYRIVLNNK